MLTDLAPKDLLMQIAWADALRWAISEPDVLARFRAETGNNWTPGSTPIEAMIDQATGADRDFIVSFARWFNRNIWGEVDGRACNGDEQEVAAVYEEVPVETQA